MNIPELPIQILAVTEHNSNTSGTLSAGIGVGILGGGLFTSAAELEARLIADGSALSDRLNAHFMTSTSAIQQKCKYRTYVGGRIV